LFYLSWLTHFV